MNNHGYGKYHTIIKISIKIKLHFVKIVVNAKAPRSTHFQTVVEGKKGYS